MTIIATSRFDSDEYKSSDALTVFQQMTSSVYYASAVGQKTNFMVKTNGYHTDQITFHDFTCKNARFRRTQEHLQGENRDFLVLQACISGEELL